MDRHNQLPPFQIYVNGRINPPGFADYEKALACISRQLLAARLSRPALVLSYGNKDPAGHRAQYFDWNQAQWIKTPLDGFGATILARQQAGAKLLGET